MIKLYLKASCSVLQAASLCIVSSKKSFPVQTLHVFSRWQHLLCVSVMTKKCRTHFFLYLYDKKILFACEIPTHIYHFRKVTPPPKNREKNCNKILKSKFFVAFQKFGLSGRTRGF